MIKLTNSDKLLTSASIIEILLSTFLSAIYEAFASSTLIKTVFLLLSRFKFSVTILSEGNGFRLIQTAGSNARYFVIQCFEIPNPIQAEYGITQGQNRWFMRGIVSFATDSACGESFMPICLIPNPNATLEPSGDENVTAVFGSNCFIICASLNVRFALSYSFSYLPAPPCLPTIFNSRCLIFASSTASLYSLDVHSSSCPSSCSESIIGLKNITCFGVRISNQIFNDDYRSI